MTFEEFAKPYQELAEHFGAQMFSAKRGKLIFDVVRDLSVMWWTATAHSMIRKHDMRFDIEAAARGELSSQRGHARVDEESAAWKNLTRQMSDRGYEETLGKLGAKSLWDAIEKKKESAS